MNLIDDLKWIKKFDSGKTLESIELLGGQILAVWQELAAWKPPPVFRKINKVIISGMGGSALGAHIVRSVFYEQLPVPLGIINGYDLPGNLDKRTLLIISSYSGNTEEPLAKISEAKKRGAKIFGITAGGKLANLIRRKEIVGYIFSTAFNPADQPRLGLGYLIASYLCLFKKLGLIKVSEAEIKKVLINFLKFQQNFGVNGPEKINLAKKFAQKLKEKIPVIVASEFLGGNIHALANQINENSKNFSCYFLLPELNHHLLEGLVFPKTNSKNLCFLFFQSPLYHPKNLRRYRLTQKILRKNRIKFLVYQLQSKEKLSQALEFLLFGSYLSFYLAIFNGVNPAKIPFVDYFKKKLNS